MNDLIRPALYNATHDIIPLTKKSSRNFSSHDFVGPICETSDRFLKTKNYQKINRGQFSYQRRWCIWNSFIFKL